MRSHALLPKSKRLRSGGPLHSRIFGIPDSQALVFLEFECIRKKRVQYSSSSVLIRFLQTNNQKM